MPGDVVSDFSANKDLGTRRRVPQADHDDDAKRYARPLPLLRGRSSLNYSLWRLRRILTRPVLWLLIVLFTLALWWGNGGSVDLQSPELRTRLKDLLPPEVTRNLHFFPASHQRIHYVGRWTTAPNRLRIDGAFPGVYFDLNVTGTTTLVLSLQNTKIDPAQVEELAAKLESEEKKKNQYHFSAASRLRIGAPPISLLGLVDGEDYVVMPNATGLTAVRLNDMEKGIHHSIRIIAPMTDNGGKGVLQLDGLWLDKGGTLLPVEGSIADTVSEEMDAFDAEGNVAVGSKNRLGFGKLLRGYTNQKKKPEARTEETEFKRRKRLVEIITDDPANFRGRKQHGTRSPLVNGLLAGVMGWEYLLGEMFSVDHVAIGVEGMCLLRNCVGAAGQPNGLGDVFFRSGPVDSPHFGHPWAFQSYAPDVLIFNLGASDYYSIVNRAKDYNMTGGELFRVFEDTYVSLIKAVRTMAYPNHPATIEMKRLGIDAYATNNAPATIPIFIMRPFGGELEWASQGAVNRLRSEGDKGVFWLDTSGWIDFEGTQTRSADVFKDTQYDPPRFHLTERGNQKVAIYLHMHVCRYLASEDEKCAFLPPEVYQGQVFDGSVATFERYIENEKERQIHDLFWREDDKDDPPLSLAAVPAFIPRTEPTAAPEAPAAPAPGGLALAPDFDPAAFGLPAAEPAGEAELLAEDDAEVGPPAGAPPA